MDGKKVAILLEDFVEDVEFIYPFYRFKEEGYIVDVLAPRVGEFKGKKGLVFHSSHRVDPDTVNEYIAVFIPGGYAPDRFRRDKETIEFIRKMYEAGKIVGAICHGPWALISAGIIKGKRVTGFFSIKDDIQNAGAIYTGKPVEVDGNLITATDPKAMPEMLKIMTAMLRERV
ncbi:type 1 glutamine amidotransferase domain-containing protein [Persephonella sp.]|uniref:type 1 glutamine amidotransferase domain-containing protein n=1 Tax=Persephonella sp. TaxID=2060922 RepID=UPI00262FA610|nr:type 1 glutamine amidotransferase domain-containing protein [Persephonella sp.]